MENTKKLLQSDKEDLPLGFFLSIIHRTHFVYLNEKIKSLDLTAGQFPFLMQISHKEGISQDDLSHHFHIDKGTVARAIKKLEDHELIYRQVDPENRRRYLLFLSENGKKMLPEISNIDQQWEENVLSGFSPQENKFLKKTLRKLAIKSLEITRGE